MEPVLVKIGGDLIEKDDQLAILAEWIKEQQEANRPVVLVHGAGKQIDSLSNQLGIAITKHNGRRITNDATREILVQVVAGTVNKRLVTLFRGHGLNPVGMTAADGMLTTSKRRPTSIENGQTIDFGLVGDIHQANPKILKILIEEGFVPVVGCVSWSEDHGLLNINADTLASALASALGCETLYLVTGAGGVLNRSHSRIEKLNPQLFNQGSKDGWISEGMIPKLQHGFEALEHNVNEVIICAPSDLALKQGTQLQLTH